MMWLAPRIIELHNLHEPASSVSADGSRKLFAAVEKLPDCAFPKHGEAVRNHDSSHLTKGHGVGCTRWSVTTSVRRPCRYNVLNGPHCEPVEVVSPVVRRLVLTAMTDLSTLPALL